MPYKDLDKKRKYQREWKDRRRRDYFEGKCCVKCGMTDYPCLQLDHINPADKVSHKIWSWSSARRLEELAKCQILCTDCHMEKTIEDTRKWRESLDTSVEMSDNQLINRWT